jgi:hypothetical protein
MRYNSFASEHGTPPDFKASNPTEIAPYMSAVVTVGETRFRLMTMSKDLFVSFGLMTDETKAKLMTGLAKECKTAQDRGDMFDLEHPNNAGVILVSRFDHDNEVHLHAQMR